MPPVIKSASKNRDGLLQITLLLAALLAILFWRSFMPGYVHFSNDGPLAMQKADFLQLPEAFIGAWDDLNWIGINSATFGFTTTAVCKMILGPVGFAKFFAPIAILIIGVCAWVFLKRLKLSRLACTLGAIAASLNSAFLGTACWGVASQLICFGMNYLALALVVSNNSTTPRLLRWLRLVLAGMAVGMGVMEGADNGAIFSMFVAAYVFYHSLFEEGSTVKKVAAGIGRVAVIAVFAGFMATQSVVGLIGTSVTGVAGMKQTPEAKAANWSFATQWSMPKVEALGLFVPGLFGYRMDSPKDMPEFLQSSYEGGNYWGAVGRDLAWDRYFAGEGPAPDPRRQYIRFNGGGCYAGVLVVLVALWAIGQSFRKKDSVFSLAQRRLIWFWAATMLISLLLAFGRFAPFFKVVYMLPYASMIRNPTKFLSVLSWALIIVFGYGIHALSRRYLETTTSSTLFPLDIFMSWWKKARGFDRRWVIGCIAFIGISIIGWIVYWQSKTQLAEYLQTVSFPKEYAESISAFSIRQLFWFIVILVIAVGLLAFILSGAFGGRRAKMGGLLLGIVLIGDLGRADLPYIVHWNYPQKYASNPIIDRLKVKAYEQRVIMSPFPAPEEMGLFSGVYGIEWSQQLFTYNNILSLDIIQYARRPVEYIAYETALSPRSNAEMFLIARRWELTSVKYILAPTITQLPGQSPDGKPVPNNYGTLDFFNNGLDRGHDRFRLVTRFELTLKPTVAQYTGDYEQLTAVEKPDGRYALYEFTGALPHVGLYSHWQVSTNDATTLKQWLAEFEPRLRKDDYGILTNLNVVDQATLKALSDANFDPHQTVLLSTPLPVAPAGTNQNPGTVSFKSYKPADIVFDAHAEQNCVLMLNDKFDPTWRVTVDGKPAELLRCNYIMRGVFITPGTHTVEFYFRPSMKPSYVTLAAMILAVLLSGLMIYSERRLARQEQDGKSEKPKSK